jgi:hypothetical protein
VLGSSQRLRAQILPRLNRSTRGRHTSTWPVSKSGPTARQFNYRPPSPSRLDSTQIARSSRPFSSPGTTSAAGHLVSKGPWLAADGPFNPSFSPVYCPEACSAIGSKTRTGAAHSWPATTRSKHPRATRPAVSEPKTSSVSNWHAPRMDSGVCLCCLPGASPVPRTNILSFHRRACSLRARGRASLTHRDAPVLLTPFAIKITAAHRRFQASLPDLIEQKPGSCNLLILRSDWNLTTDRPRSWVQPTSADCIIATNAKPLPEGLAPPRRYSSAISLSKGSESRTSRESIRPYLPGLPLRLWHRSRKAGVRCWREIEPFFHARFEASVGF